MKKLIVLIAFLLTACSKPPSFSHTDTVIEWVDFIQINDHEYVSTHSGVIADLTYIGEGVGEVKFEVNEHVTNPNYQVKNGDAAYWAEGTKIFTVKDMPGFIAVQDRHKINDYQIYMEESISYPNDVKDIDLKKINKIEIYEGYNNPNLIKTYSSGEAIGEFMTLLVTSEKAPSYEPDISQLDPKMFYFVLYDQQPIAFQHSFFFDGVKWYWFTDEIEILPDKIGQFIKMGDSC